MKKRGQWTAKDWKDLLFVIVGLGGFYCAVWFFIQVVEWGSDRRECRELVDFAESELTLNRDSDSQ
jgi:hypothetical protein